MAFVSGGDGLGYGAGWDAVMNRRRAAAEARGAHGSARRVTCRGRRLAHRERRGRHVRAVPVGGGKSGAPLLKLEGHAKRVTRYACRGAGDERRSRGCGGDKTVKMGRRTCTHISASASCSLGLAASSRAYVCVASISGATRGWRQGLADCALSGSHRHKVLQRSRLRGGPCTARDQGALRPARRSWRGEGRLRALTPTLLPTRFGDRSRGHDGGEHLARAQAHWDSLRSGASWP